MYHTEEEAREAYVSKSQAREEIARHGCDFNHFQEEVGDKEEYKGSEVLDWLGY